jgi:hypothetical protein
MRKGLVSPDGNHTGIEAPVKVREKLQPAEERVDGQGGSISVDTPPAEIRRETKLQA